MSEREWVISNSMSGFMFFPRGLRRRHLEVVKRDKIGCLSMGKVGKVGFHVGVLQKEQRQSIC